ncbi:MAG: hypothetical protein ACOX3T_01135 [Bdellovibrionota bacterium]
MKDTTLYQKIKKLIEVSPEEKFISYDERLISDKAYPKPRKTWEVMHTVRINDGVLVFRESTPLASIYVAGGYQFKEADAPRYTIELRPEGWDAIELVDPFRIVSEHADKTYEILAEGHLAKELVELVQNKLDIYNSHAKEEFKNLVIEKLDYLKRHLQETDGMWKKREDSMAMVYSATFDDIMLNICKEKTHYSAKYFIFAKKKSIAIKIDDNAFCQELYELIDKLSEVTGLINLEKALEDLKPKDDNDDWEY